MSQVQAERFEPVYLQPEQARLTEYGKRYFENQNAWVSRFGNVWKDVCKLKDAQEQRWETVKDAIRTGQGREFDPVMLTSGLSKYAMGKLLDHVVGKTSFTLPTVVSISLGTAAPTSSTTGVWANETAYVTFVRPALTEATWTNAATAADPTVVTNNGAITFAACTGTGSTLLGFLIVDNETLNTGNAFFYGSLSSTVISTTQTPPTIATTAMSLSLTGT